MTEPLAGRRIAVLLGGVSSERDVSLVTGRECANALERLGARVTRVDAGRDVAAVLSGLKPDLCFNALHGEWGEDGCIQGVLETLCLPYTHSGVLASALAMDKTRAKAVLAAAPIPVPGGGLFNRFDVAREHVISPPYVVKANAEGSSIGVFIVREGANQPPQQIIEQSWRYGEEVLVEPFIPGRELAVGVMNGEAITVTEIVVDGTFYDYEAKYAEGGSKHILPADLPEHVISAAKELSERAHRVLGCRGVTRVDLRYDDDHELLVVLEVNTQPGMTPTSLVPEQAAHLGVTFDQLVLSIAQEASARASVKGQAAGVDGG